MPHFSVYGGPSGRKVGKIPPQFVANAAKHSDPFIASALCLGRVLETVVNSHGLAGKDRAAFLGVVANGEHVIELLAGEFVDPLLSGGRKYRCRARP